jgi:hypothetical protein
MIEGMMFVSIFVFDFNLIRSGLFNLLCMKERALDEE